MIECNKNNCHSRYIRETKRPPITNSYFVNNHVDKATRAHYNLPRHSLANVKVTILEQIRYGNDNYRKERERYFINKCNTLNRGLNRNKGTDPWPTP